MDKAAISWSIGIVVVAVGIAAVGAGTVNDTVDTPIVSPPQAITEPEPQPTATAPGQADPAYTDENFNLSIVFPKGWIILTPGADNFPNIAEVYPLTGERHRIMAVFVESASGRSLDDAVQSILADLQEYVEVGTLEISDQERVDINGRAVFLLDLAWYTTIYGQPIDGRGQVATLIASGNVYTFIHTSEAHNFDSSQILFEESLRSFRVLVDDSSDDDI